MQINNINDFLGFKDLEVDKDKNKIGNNEFGNMLKNTIKEVNDLQIESEDMKKKLAIGEVDNLHDVSIISEKANIALQVTMAIRSKMVEAYKEIMRIQV